MEKVVKKIIDEGADKVCIQLPDGLKPKADAIYKELKKKTGCDIIIWGGSCFGACDVPLSVEGLGIDLLIQWGHSEWI